MSRIPLDTKITDSDGTEYTHDKGDESSLNLERISRIVSSALGDFIPGESVSGVDPEKNAWKFFGVQKADDFDELNLASNIGGTTVLSKDNFATSFKQEKIDVKVKDGELSDAQNSALDSFVSALKSNMIKKAESQIEVKVKKGTPVVKKQQVDGKFVNSVDNELDSLVDAIVSDISERIKIRVKLEREKTDEPDRDANELLGIATAVPAIINGTLVDLKGDVEALDMKKFLGDDSDKYFALHVVPHSFGQDETYLENRVAKSRHGDADFVLRDVTDQLGDSFRDGSQTGLRVTKPQDLDEDGAVLIGLISVPSGTSNVGDMDVSEVHEARPTLEEINDTLEDQQAQIDSVKRRLVRRYLAEIEGLADTIADEDMSGSLETSNSNGVDEVANRDAILSAINSTETALDNDEDLSSVKSELQSLFDAIETAVGSKTQFDLDDSVRAIYDKIDGFLRGNRVMIDEVKDELRRMSDKVSSIVKDFQSFKDKVQNGIDLAQQKASEALSEIDKLEDDIGNGTGGGGGSAGQGASEDLIDVPATLNSDVTIQDNILRSVITDDSSSTTIYDKPEAFGNEYEKNFEQGVVNPAEGLGYLFPLDGDVTIDYDNPEHQVTNTNSPNSAAGTSLFGGSVDPYTQPSLPTRVVTESTNLDVRDGSLKGTLIAGFASFGNPVVAFFSQWDKDNLIYRAFVFNPDTGQTDELIGANSVKVSANTENFTGGDFSASFHKEGYGSFVVNDENGGEIINKEFDMPDVGAAMESIPTDIEIEAWGTLDPTSGALNLYVGDLVGRSGTTYGDGNAVFDLSEPFSDISTVSTALQGTDPDGSSLAAEISTDGGSTWTTLNDFSDLQQYPGGLDNPDLQLRLNFTGGDQTAEIQLDRSTVHMDSVPDTADVNALVNKVNEIINDGHSGTINELTL